MSATFSYVGSELEIFREAVHWKRYLRAQIGRYVRGDVLEVGAGLGGTTSALHDGHCESWTCLEPDPALVARLEQSVGAHRDRSGRSPAIVLGTLLQLEPSCSFDCILYIDVLEHIEDDRRELALAAQRLRDGGYLIVLAPAHPWLFSPFDEAVGHFRRYTRATLGSAAPLDLRVIALRYLDSAGVIASFANRAFVRSGTPTRAQIKFWDGVLVPTSRVLDRCLVFRVGKSVLGVWRRG